jgi:hypothetical protein
MKKKYQSPQMKILIASCRNHLALESLIVGDDVVSGQGAKSGSFFGFDDNEDVDEKPNYNVWDY